MISSILPTTIPRSSITASSIPSDVGGGWPTVCAVAVGGAIGALARYGIAQELPAGGGTGFPWATLLVNVLGSGLLALALRRSMSPVLAAGLRTGALGSFTTFSAFAVETAVLAEQTPVMAALYVVASLGGGLLAATITSPRHPAAPVSETLDGEGGA